MSPTPIIARISITKDKWQTVRKQAIDKSVPTSQLLAEWVRTHLEVERIITEVEASRRRGKK